MDEGQSGRRELGVHEHCPCPLPFPHTSLAAGLEPRCLLRQQMHSQMQGAAPYPCLCVANTKA